MNNRILKSIIAGIILGTIIYFTGPFIFMFFIVVMTLKFIFTPFGMGRMMMMNRIGHHGMGRFQMAFADKIRNMNDEEYKEYQEKIKTRFENFHCHHSSHFEQKDK